MDNRQVNDDAGEVIHPSVESPPLVSSYNDKIRPILDAVDKLRHLQVTQEGIPLPTIVVVGDQSSGKSSVLESLAGISLPRGQGICTRVPLVMRLQHHRNPTPEFVLQFKGKEVKIEKESEISEAIAQATVEVAGDRKGIANVPLTLVVKKKGVPDLTMVDLPGITRVPVHDQPQDIYEQISAIIMEHIKPEESIILNVLSATADFSTCESILMSRRVDTTGQRTLAVVTKCDQSPDGLYEKVTENDVDIGLGYICVRNRINNESYDEARSQEATIFDSHHLLSKIDKSMVGTPVLARRLVEIQSIIISKCLPEIVKKIDEKLDRSVLELNKLPPLLMNMTDATVAFTRVVGSFKESLQRILIRGKIDDHVDDKQMHCNARLIEMLNEFSQELHKSVAFSGRFLEEEMQVLEEANGIRLPHFYPHSTFLYLLKKKVDAISELPISFANKVWGYLETICVRVLVDHCSNYPQLLPLMRKAVQNVIRKTKDRFVDRVVEMIDMEKITDYTSDPEFVTSWNKLMGSTRNSFLKLIKEYDDYYTTLTMYIEGHDEFDIKHLVGVSAEVRDQAFDLKMKMTAYWEIVLKRMVDWIALQLHYLIHKLVETEMVNETMVRGGGIEKMLEEPPSLAVKRERLQRSIKLFRESKKVIEQVMDGIPVMD